MSTITIIDDDPMLLDIGVSILKQHGFFCLPALTGQHGIDLIEHHHPDLILLDILLPDIDGIQVCQQLHDRSDTRSIPVILLTALESEKFIQSGFESGAHDFIMKPFHWDELIARIHFHLSMHRYIVRLQNSQAEACYWHAKYEKLSEYVLHWIEIFGKTYWAPGPFHEAVEQFKNALIRYAYLAHGGKIKKAAQSLEISTRSFRRRLQQTSIPESSDQSGDSVRE